MKGLPDPRQRPWLTVAEVAQITGEGQKAIRAALKAGQLPVLRIGRYVRIPTAGFYALVGVTPDNSDARPASQAVAPTLASQPRGHFPTSGWTSRSPMRMT